MLRNEHSYGVRNVYITYKISRPGNIQDIRAVLAYQSYVNFVEDLESIMDEVFHVSGKEA